MCLYGPESDPGPGWLIRSFLRNHSTPAEAVLWTYLKSASIDGRKFRRQHSIGEYIADFYCPSEKLIVELDGEPHGDYIQIEKDKIRGKFLEGNNHPGPEVNLAWFKKQ